MHICSHAKFHSFALVAVYPVFSCLLLESKEMIARIKGREKDKKKKTRYNAGDIADLVECDARSLSLARISLSSRTCTHTRSIWVFVIFVSEINLLLQSWKHAPTDLVIQIFEYDALLSDVQKDKDPTIRASALSHSEIFTLISWEIRSITTRGDQK